MKQCVVLVIALFGAGTYFVPNQKKCFKIFQNKINQQKKSKKNGRCQFYFIVQPKATKNEEYKIVIVIFFLLVSKYGFWSIFNEEIVIKIKIVRHIAIELKTKC